jgi:uncharacterized protein Yka (UPF0111/DUF47 family)
MRKVVSILVKASRKSPRRLEAARHVQKAGDDPGPVHRNQPLENEADEALRLAISNLFEREKDPIRVIKEKEILETIENAADRRARTSPMFWKASS